MTTRDNSLLQLTLVRVREFIREPEAVFWTLIFPILMASGLGIAYYANSYVCRPAAGEDDAVTAWSEHEGDRFPASVRRGAAVGVQFHPEKSSAQGLAFVRAFVQEVTRDA